MKIPIRWGILGTGSIATKFATGLQALPDAELAAVGSRTRENADRFGDRFGVRRRYADYEALANDQDVDVVYIGTPHSLHRDNSILCLEAGKAVLCEKPITINAEQAEEVIRCARSTGRFLMEAMWTRFLPAVVQVRRWLTDGVIGDIRMMMADFGFRAGVNPEGRLFNPALGGGGLLDVGIYTVSLASLVFGGRPSRIMSMADIGATGVDEQAGMLLGYDGGRLAALTCAVRTSTPQEVVIMGTDGMIRIASPFWDARRATLAVSGSTPEHSEPPRVGNGYNYEAEEVMRLLRAGATESDVIPLDESLAIMRTLDEIRAQWGLKYPME